MKTRAGEMTYMAAPAPHLVSGGSDGEGVASRSEGGAQGAVLEAGRRSGAKAEAEGARRLLSRQGGSQHMTKQQKALAHGITRATSCAHVNGPRQRTRHLSKGTGGNSLVGASDDLGGNRC